jgi:hypothetical protein
VYNAIDGTLSTLTMISVWSLILGTGRSSMTTLPGPLNTTAFIVSLLMTPSTLTDDDDDDDDDDDELNDMKAKICEIRSTAKEKNDQVDPEALL